MWGRGKVSGDDSGDDERGHGRVAAGDAGFATFGGDGSVVVFDVETGARVPKGTIKTEADCDGIFYDAATQKVILVSGDGNSGVADRSECGCGDGGRREGPLAAWAGRSESFCV